jgi:8-oxo-dGTP pyrophosphatase MutT (NUDIX family)
MKDSTDFILRLQQRFEKGLPGRAHQYKMANAVRQNFKFQPTPSDATLACVLILLHLQNEHWHLVLMERTHAPNDKHAGQVSFPGGRFEETDISPKHCALREAQEEVGIDPNKIVIIGQMTELYIPVSGFQVLPFLGYTTQPLDFAAQPSEVQHIITPPLSTLTNPDNLKLMDKRINETTTLYSIPYYDVMGREVWGATAMMIAELVEILNTLD